MDDKEKTKEKDKEPIWSIRQEWRNTFCVFVLFFSVITFILTLVEKQEKSWIEIIGLFGDGVVGIVGVVWTGFILAELVMGYYTNALIERDKQDREFVKMITASQYKAYKDVTGEDWRPPVHVEEKAEEYGLRKIKELRQYRRFWWEFWKKKL